MIVFISGALIEDFVVYEKEDAILIRTPNNGKLQLEEQYCGDYSLWYIVKYDSLDNEISRHNLKYVAEFTYKQNKTE